MSYESNTEEGNEDKATTTVFPCGFKTFAWEELLCSPSFPGPALFLQPNPGAFAHVAVAVFCPSSFELLVGRNMPQLLVGQEVETTREESSDEASLYSEVI